MTREERGADAPTAKKGKPSWQPAEMLNVKGMEGGFRYRWERNDAAQIAKAESEGFEIVSGVSSRAKRTDQRAVDDGMKLTSVTEHRELVLMRIPEDVAQARSEYFAKESTEILKGTKADAQTKLDGLAQGRHAPQVRGAIVID